MNRITAKQDSQSQGARGLGGLRVSGARGLGGPGARRLGGSGARLPESLLAGEE